MWNHWCLKLKVTKLLTSSIKKTHRDRLFWDRYQYCAIFRQSDINLIRGLCPDLFQRNLQYRKKWANIQNRGHIDEGQLIETFEFFRAAPGPIKLTFSWEYCYVYTNELNWIKTLPQICPWITVFDVSEAVVDRPRDQVSLLNPTHQYRTWFREKAVTREVKQRLANWVQAQGTEIKLSPSLTRWLESKEEFANVNKFWFQRHFFIEHNSPQYETMLNMIMPAMVRKTQTVSQRTK